MPELERCAAGTSAEEVCAVVARDGAMILEGVLSSEEVARSAAELRPYIDATKNGVDDFTGRQTKRTGALVARSAASRAMIVHDAILPAARKFLAPWCDTIQLHLSQVITIQPGQKEQPIHRDRWAWGTYLDRALQPQFNTIWARQEENQYLACPPEVARALDPELAALIGYARGSYALGYYTPPLPPGEGPELVGPEWATGQTREEGRLGTGELFESLHEQVRGTPDA